MHDKLRLFNITPPNWGIDAIRRLDEKYQYTCSTAMLRYESRADWHCPELLRGVRETLHTALD